MKNGWVVAVVLVGVTALAISAVGGARTDDPLGVAVSPQMILLGADDGGSVKVHTDIPYSSVVTFTLELSGLPATGSYADSLGNLVAVFSESDVKTMVAPPSAVLTLTGLYVDGVSFAGSDEVKVTVYNKPAGK